MRSDLVIFSLCGVLLASATASAAEELGFALETGSPDALCPALETTREVVRRRLGSLVEDGHRGWRARYTIAHAPSGHPRDFVRLELFNPDGGTELVRDLPMEGESCRTMAEVIALVLDRHFRGLVANERSASVAPAPAAATVRTAEPVVLVAPEANDRADVSSPSTPWSSSRPTARLALELVEALPEARARAGARALFPLQRHLDAGVAVAFDLASREERLPRAGGVETWQGGGRAFIAGSIESGRWLAYAGPGLSATFERGTTFELPERHTKVRLLTSVGLDAGFLVALGRRWFFGSALELDWRQPWASGRFAVDGEEVLAPRPFALKAGLGFGYAFRDSP